ncbi:MAG: Uma2 family endonuclease [Blastocatellia bacterium]
MQTEEHWTSQDLDRFPDNGNRYEIIGGELFVSKQPHYHHQYTCGQIHYFLQGWSLQTELGQAVFAPGLIFADDDDVAPDVIWISYQRRAVALAKDGKLHLSPEIAVEVLSPGSVNQRRDRKEKLALYSRRGVQEYWIVDWMIREVEVYRRKRKQLKLVETLHQKDNLQSPLLPGFSCSVRDLFDQIPIGFQSSKSDKKS